MNAILLAAGLGSRFKEVTKNNHKALLPVGGVPNIERTIQYLKEYGVEDIVIVVGYMAHLFDYLIEKYQVKLIVNEHYADYNNLYSMYCALDELNDSIVIDADVVLLDQIFPQLGKSGYFTIQRPKSTDLEWCPRVVDGRVVAMDITDEFRPSMLGISYWNHEDCGKIKDEVNRRMKIEENYQNPKLYWDNIPVDLLDELDVTTYPIDERLVNEMDTVENYQETLKKFEEMKK